MKHQKPVHTTASTLSGLCLLLLALFMMVVTAASSDSNDVEDVTRIPIRSSPPVVPMLFPRNELTTEVTIHVAERFLPFGSKTTIGPYLGPSHYSEEDSDEGDDDRAFRVMFSFSAYVFSEANAAIMACFSISDDGSSWEKASPGSLSSTGQAFCTQRGLSDDSSSYGVAVFRKTTDGPSLVHASRDSTANVIAEAVIRGWKEPPVVAFRVRRLEVWQVVPSLPLVVNISVISVLADNTDRVAAYCSQDPLGHEIHRIEGGNYYQNATEQMITNLCVSYVERSLRDINGIDKFFTHVRPVELSTWRFNVCPWGSKEVMDAVTHTNALLPSPDQDLSLICYKYETIAEDDDEDDASDLIDTDELLKRIWIDDTKPFGISRLVIEHHNADAWTLALHDDDLVAINSF